MHQEENTMRIKVGLPLSQVPLPIKSLEVEEGVLLLLLIAKQPLLILIQNDRDCPTVTMACSHFNYPGSKQEFQQKLTGRQTISPIPPSISRLCHVSQESFISSALVTPPPFGPMAMHPVLPVAYWLLLGEAGEHSHSHLRTPSSMNNCISRRILCEKGKMIGY